MISDGLTKDLARVPLQGSPYKGIVLRQRGHSTHRIHTSRQPCIDVALPAREPKILGEKPIQEMRSCEAKDHGGRNRKKIALQDVYFG